MLPLSEPLSLKELEELVPLELWPGYCQRSRVNRKTQEFHLPPDFPQTFLLSDGRLLAGFPWKLKHHIGGEDTGCHSANDLAGNIRVSRVVNKGCVQGV